jgi:hypothetical protein
MFPPPALRTRVSVFWASIGAGLKAPSRAISGGLAPGRLSPAIVPGKSVSSAGVPSQKPESG